MPNGALRTSPPPLIAALLCLFVLPNQNIPSNSDRQRGNRICLTEAMKYVPWRYGDSAERAYLPKVRLKRPSPCPDLLTRVRICKLFKEPRNRFPACWAGTTTHLSYRADWLHRLSESIPRNPFLGMLNVFKYGLSVPEPSAKQGRTPIFLSVPDLEV